MLQVSSPKVGSKMKTDIKTTKTCYAFITPINITLTTYTPTWANVEKKVNDTKFKCTTYWACQSIKSAYLEDRAKDGEFDHWCF